MNGKPFGLGFELCYEQRCDPQFTIYFNSTLKIWGVVSKYGNEEIFDEEQTFKIILTVLNNDKLPSTHYSTEIYETPKYCFEMFISSIFPEDSNEPLDCLIAAENTIATIISSSDDEEPTELTEYFNHFD